jgi:protein FRG1
MVKPLTFKGDKKLKKRKHHEGGDNDDGRIQPNKPTTPAEDEGTPSDQSWVSADVPTDINGPIVIVLPSSPPTCIACDINGKVFASELENMIEGDAGTAEPHDVRQVWIATRAAGSEGFGFKGHHGK